MCACLYSTPSGFHMLLSSFEHQRVYDLSQLIPYCPPYGKQGHNSFKTSWKSFLSQDSCNSYIFSRCIWKLPVLYHEPMLWNINDLGGFWKYIQNIFQNSIFGLKKLIFLCCQQSLPLDIKSEAGFWIWRPPGVLLQLKLSYYTMN